jgi:hypothetical protein
VIGPFFEDLTEDALQAFDYLAPTIAAIPLAVRQRQTAHKLRLGSQTDLNRDWATLLECMASPLIRDDHPSPPGARCINPELHTKGFANPSTREIQSLMATIGIKDCWEVLEDKLGSRAKLGAIDAVVHRRNQIAHGNLDSWVSRLDVEGYIDLIQAVCDAFDVMVGEYITSCTESQSPWNIPSKPR